MHEKKTTYEAIMKSNKLITPDSVLFFDMDGTLINTDYANFLSYKKAIESVMQYNFDFPYSPNQRFNRSLLKTAIPNLTETEVAQIICEKEKCYHDFISETKLNIAIADILFKYSKINRTVLVTNCREERAVITLDHHKLTDQFSNAFYRQFSEKGNRKINKFQNAISVLGISPNLVVAFENEEIEIIDAKQSGIEIVNPIII